MSDRLAPGLLEGPPRLLSVSETELDGLGTIPLLKTPGSALLEDRSGPLDVAAAALGIVSLLVALVLFTGGGVVTSLKL